MRIITTGIATAALAVAAMAGAGAAAADDDPGFNPPKEIVTVDINLLGCSIGAGLGAQLVPTLSAGGFGGPVGIDAGLASRLRSAGCLPWR
ncbi:hypothetical protein J2W56_000222 [Nocardia kruczakiae]|uniref:Secreted protein n=1 Tax=Nocardia kruczakiae TaxID=261477 RepID=A0ABU1X8B6_9NOCA|nr:hypothetical protein [Nocardia kruczakiae]MDR7166504.1 hypothetical protein [Nocardia kruczakiae]